MRLASPAPVIVPFALLSLVACSGADSVNVINNNMGPRPAAAAATPGRTAAPVTRFDGDWGLTFTAGPSSGQQCPPPPSREIVMAVNQGNAELNMGKVYTGVVNEGGEVRVSDRMDRSIAILGSFQGERFVGEFRNGPCRYAVSGKKR